MPPGCPITGGPAYKVVLMDSNGNIINTSNPLIVSEGWKVAVPWTAPAGFGNDRRLVVPAGFEYQILWIFATLTTGVGVGNRQMAVRTYDHLGNLSGSLGRASVVQAASLVRSYLFAPGVADLLGFRDTDYLSTPIPVTTILGPSQQLQIYDNKNISVGGDTLAVRVQYAYRPIV
jgi:hypothetical protein